MITKYKFYWTTKMGAKKEMGFFGVPFFSAEMLDFTGVEGFWENVMD